MKAVTSTTFALMLSAALATNGALAQSAAAPLAFNYGYTTADHVNLYVAQDLGLFEKVGLKPNFHTFPSGAPLLAALKSESLDVVTAGLGFAFALGQKIPVTMIFWNSNDSTGEGLVVDAKSGIKSFQDIGKAKKIGAASGTCAQVALYLMGKKVGIDYGKLDVVNIPAPLMRNSFMSNSIDAGIAWSPYSVMLDAEGFKVVSWDSEYTPPGGLCPRTTAARPAFLKAHPEIGVKLLEVDAMASEAVAKNPQVAIDALVKRLALTPAVAKATIERVYMQRPTYAQQVDATSPYSMTSKDGGLAGKYLLATQVLYETKSVPEPVPMNVIQEAIDARYLVKYLDATKAKK
ncbi:MAG TPA: ABC transporter substrate-binding protein [Casimicrobiaceae bacterium]|nr:ABC transporter substrate-binding protein [Casimicrobiaceae bacterium]